MVAIYHRVYRRENFEKATKDLVGLVYAAEQRDPGVPRALFLDIDGHRNDVPEKLVIGNQRNERGMIAWKNYILKIIQIQNLEALESELWELGEKYLEPEVEEG